MREFKAYPREMRLVKITFVIFFIAALAMGVFLFLVPIPGHEEDPIPDYLLVPCLLMLLPLLLWALVSVRYQVTDEGISKRSFFIWRFWPWEAFEGARKGMSPYEIHFPHLPLTRRSLSLLDLPLPEREDLWEECVERLERQSPVRCEEEAPKTLRLRQGILYSVLITPDEVIYRRFFTSTSYTWDEVQITVWRLSNRPHAVMAAVQFHFPNATFVCKVFSVWPGPNRNVVACFLAKRVTPNVIKYYGLSELSHSVEEVDAREEVVSNTYKGRRAWVWGMALMFLALPVVGISRMRSSDILAWLSFALVATPGVLMGIAGPRIVRREYLQANDRLQRERERLLTGNNAVDSAEADK
jgi:hypothetical protein